MSLKEFYLPAIDCAKYLFSKDLNTSSIPETEIENYLHYALNIGIKSALDFGAQIPLDNIDGFLNEQGITIEYQSRIKHAFNTKVYSEYYSAKKKIILYESEIKAAMELLKSDDYPYLESYEQAQKLFKIHEYFHHLECHKIGLTYKKLPSELEKRGIFKQKIPFMSLSEIAAYQFTKEVLAIMR